MSLCCECCVLTGRGLCVGLITRPEESHRLRCVVVCVCVYVTYKPHKWGGPGPLGGCCVKNIQTLCIYITYSMAWNKSHLFRLSNCIKLGYGGTSGVSNSYRRANISIEALGTAVLHKDIYSVSPTPLPP
jgi:hypothetical protein